MFSEPFCLSKFGCRMVCVHDVLCTLPDTCAVTVFSRSSHIISGPCPAWQLQWLVAARELVQRLPGLVVGSSAPSMRCGPRVEPPFGGLVCALWRASSSAAAARVLA